jgi:flagellum-specific peptidoglycan hydrolase FlgJ
VDGAKFPKDIIDYARTAQKQTGCLASVALAQWAQESDYGKDMPPGSNNPFGIKAASGQPFVLCRTHEEKNGRLIAVISRFRKFPTILDSFIEHGKLLMNPNGPYRAALAYRQNWAKFVDRMAPIYATDHNYASELRSLIVKNKLFQYDLTEPKETHTV